MYTTNPDLGSEIHQLLLDANLENQADFVAIQLWNDPKQIAILNQQLKGFLNTLGLANAHNNQQNAARLVNFWCQERFYGLNYNNFPHITAVVNEFNYNSPLIAENIKFVTTCEHHLVPINGTAVIAYTPKKHLVGLNKLNCVVEFFSHRPQLQERLTLQIFKSLKYLLKTEDVAVIIKARHECISSNGINDVMSYHTTYQFSGDFATNPTLQQQLLGIIIKPDGTGP